MRAPGLLILLFLCAPLSSCVQLRVGGFSTTNESATPEEAALQPEASNTSSTPRDLSDFRQRAAASTPASTHLGWKLYHMDGYVYGRSDSAPDQEFLTRKVDKEPDSLVLVGKSCWKVLLESLVGKSLVIHQPLKRSRSFRAAERSRTILKDGKITIQGSEQNNILQFPLE
ncbi:MAG: hypothetical protein HRU46_19175 [Verrucomicrobiales bacterium]|nr:hypothetical protein [Verrucomicrobiales bacterium]